MQNDRYEASITNIENLIKNPILSNYYKELISELYEILQKVTPTNFIEIVSRLLAIDSKMQLLSFYTDHLEFLDLDSNSIIDLIEKEFLFYNREIFEINMNDVDSPSIIFNISPE